MKRFIFIYVGCIILVYIITFFSGLIFSNFNVLMLFIALALAIVVSIFVHQEIKIEELEKRLDDMDSQKDLKELE